eukprot:8707804-Alexandrium_andersonii.AAC.1
MREALLHADWLKERALAQGTDLWHIVYKHHFAEHLAEAFAFMNPRVGWTFKAEDYVGRIAVLAHSCSFG